jgi:protein required for attachment to host cells
MENIMKIFNSQDEIELKQAFKEIIKDQFKNEVEDNDMYLFDPNEIEAMILEAFEEVINDVKQEYKEKLREKMLAMVDKDINKIIKSKK